MLPLLLVVLVIFALTDFYLLDFAGVYLKLISRSEFVTRLRLFGVGEWVDGS